MCSTFSPLLLLLFFPISIFCENLEQQELRERNVLIAFIIGLVFVAIVVIGAVVGCVVCSVRGRRRKRKDYQKLKNDEVK